MAIYLVRIMLGATIECMKSLRIFLFVMLACLLLPASPAKAAADPPPPEIGLPVSSDSPALVPQYTGCGGVNVAVTNAAWEQQVVELVNAERAKNALPPLKRVTALDNAARYHAADLAQDDYFEHNSYDRSGGSLVQVCEWSTRISGYYSGWNSLAENIAAGYGDPASVMSGWMNSQGHRANILSTSNWEIGVGYYAGGSYGKYWVQDFGRHTNQPPVVINSEAAITTSPNVTLYIYGTWDEMRLRNDSGAWTAWQAFQQTSSWTLPQTSGVHTVSVEMRKGAQTVSASDTITLDVPQVPPPVLPPRVYVPLLVK